MDGLRFNVLGRLFLIRRESTCGRPMHWEQMESIRPAGFVVPDFVEEAELEQYMKLSRATIHRMRAAEGFPKPIHLGTRRSALRLKDVQDWLSSLPNTR